MTPRVSLVCTDCGYTLPEDSRDSSCSKCGRSPEYVWDEEYLKTVEFTGDLKFWRYRQVLPPVSRLISLGEGGTPLQHSQRLAETLGLRSLYLKDETRNPTSSFKDRTATLLVSDAASKGFSSLICATNGNQGASLSAYAAKADLDCHLIVPKHVDLGKLAQMMVYNAEIVESGETIEDSIMRARVLESETGWYQATTELNPLSSEALKTISYEVYEQGGVPDYIVLAMGSGVTMTSLWKGFKELQAAGKTGSLPKMIGIQAEGCSPITQAYAEHGDHMTPLPRGETEAIAIRVADPIYGKNALSAIRESGGTALTVTDEEMLQAGREVARLEGIYPEPASASTVASLKHLKDSGVIDARDRVVCVITSSGLKTSDILQTLTKKRKSPGLGSMLTTKEKILRLVSGGETYGYEVWKALGKGMTIGAVYQHVSDLEKRGLIYSVTRGKRRYFSVTERGQRVLGALDDLQALL